MKSPDSQEVRIYDRLVVEGSITVLDGLYMEPPITCVGQRMTGLKKIVAINEEWETSPNGARYKRWSLAKKEE